MTHLDAVAGQVRQRIETFRGRPGAIGESNTKASLIEPLLDALGWDVHDPAEVHREWKHQSTDNPVDYGLLVDGSPLLLIEAKGLGENITDPRWANQLIGYAAVAGVSWVALTDGDTWLIYNAAVVAPTAKKRFRSVSLTDDLVEAVSTLALLHRSPTIISELDVLWSANQTDRAVRRAVEDLFSEAHREALHRAVAPLARDIAEDDLAAGLRRLRVQVTLDASAPATPAPLSANAPQPPKAAKKRTTRMSDAEKRITLREMVDAGAIAPGQRLVARYLGSQFEATVGPTGDVLFEGQSYSPSGAGTAVKLKVQPDAPKSVTATQGMSFWAVPGENGARDRKLIEIRAELAKTR